MENMTSDNLYICMLAMLKIAYNFWPCIAFVIGYAVWETVTTRQVPARVRLKSRNANYSDRDR